MADCLVGNTWINSLLSCISWVHIVSCSPSSVHVFSICKINNKYILIIFVVLVLFTKSALKYVVTEISVTLQRALAPFPGCDNTHSQVLDSHLKTSSWLLCLCPLPRFQNKMGIIIGPMSHLQDETFELIFSRWNLSNQACTVCLYNKKSINVSQRFYTW